MPQFSISLFLVVVVSLDPLRSVRADQPPTPGEELAALRLADPALTIELVAAEPEVVEPGRVRLGRARPAVRRRDDRLPGRRHRRPDQAARGSRRRRTIRARHGLRREAALSQRRPPLERRRAGHRGPRPALLQGHRRRRQGRRPPGDPHRLRRGQSAAPRQQPDLGPGQLGLPGQRPERRRSPTARRPSGEGRADPPQRPPAPARDGRVRAGRRVQPVRPAARRLGRPLPFVEHGAGAPRRRSKTSPNDRIAASLTDVGPVAEILDPSRRRSRLLARPVAAAGSTRRRSPSSTRPAARRFTAATCWAMLIMVTPSSASH